MRTTHKKHLSGNINSAAGSHISSTFTTLSFGPPKLSVASNRSQDFVTVGLVQNITVNQQRQILRITDMGNDKQWIVPGKTKGSLQLQRVLYDGPSLLKYIAYGMIRNGSDKTSILQDHLKEGFANSAYHEMGFPSETDLDLPGSGDFWMNLSSDIFREPVGIVIEIKQMTPSGELLLYGGTFLEECVVSAHSLQMASEQRVIAETVQIDFVRAFQHSSKSNVLEIEEALKKTVRSDS